MTLISAGIDDATKCPCIGSIFISGVVADKNTISAWKKAGVKDSKLLLPNKREILSVLIKDTASCYSVKEIPPEKIDDKNLNLNEWEMLTCIELIDDMLDIASFSRVIIDNWEVSKKMFFKRLSFFFDRGLYLKNPAKIKKLDFIPEHRADQSHTIVGAASILSKTSSDYQYRDLKSRFGDFGSGSPADPRTRLFVWKNRKNPPKIIRKTWYTFKTLSVLDDPWKDPIIAKSLKNQSEL